MNIYKDLIRPALFLGDPEAVHRLAMTLLRILGPMLNGTGPMLAPLSVPPDPRLERTVFGVKFPHPVGLAAGFDKNAEALLAWQLLGFGFVEAGTVTARAQPGNPKPRIFRIPEYEALINRLGFNNDGADAVAARLQKLRQSGRWPAIPLGINLGKSKLTPLEEATSDYLLSFQRLYHFGDYFVLNVSSPNTPGLRTLQSKAALDELIDAIQRHNPAKRPLLVKIAPDLEWGAIEQILELVTSHQCAGIIATNTTLDHTSIPANRREQGGLSGRPLRPRSTEIVRFVAKHSSIPVIAVGGIHDVDSALEKFDAGAALVQLYTGFIYEGPGLIRQICSALLAG